MLEFKINAFRFCRIHSLRSICQNYANIWKVEQTRQIYVWKKSQCALILISKKIGGRGKLFL